MIIAGVSVAVFCIFIVRFAFSARLGFVFISWVLFAAAIAVLLRAVASVPVLSIALTFAAFLFLLRLLQAFCLRFWGRGLRWRGLFLTWPE